MAESTVNIVRMGTPAELLAVIPQLVGFAPDNSIVVVGTEPLRGSVKVTLRYNLPDPPDARAAADIAAHAQAVLATERIRAAVAVGYGPAGLVNPVADAPRGAGLLLPRVLRVEGGRYWYAAPHDGGRQSSPILEHTERNP